MRPADSVIACHCYAYRSFFVSFPGNTPATATGVEEVAGKFHLCISRINTRLTEYTEFKTAIVTMPMGMMLLMMMSLMRIVWLYNIYTPVQYVEAGPRAPPPEVVYNTYSIRMFKVRIWRF